VHDHNVAGAYLASDELIALLHSLGVDLILLGSQRRVALLAPQHLVQALGQSAQRFMRLDIDPTGVDAAIARGPYARSQRTRSGAAGA
jgi:hypothetical protein